MKRSAPLARKTPLARKSSAVKAKAKKKPLPSIKQLRDKLWELTSLYVRAREADVSGMAACVTCGVRKPWKELQAGHWIPRVRGNGTRWDLRNIHPQCSQCNLLEGGNLAPYYLYMVNRYGPSVLEELAVESGSTVQFKRADYEARIEDIAGRLARLGLRSSPVVTFRSRQSVGRTWEQDHIS